MVDEHTCIIVPSQTSEDCVSSRLLVLRPCYSPVVKSISQRELRNDSGAVLRQVEQGATFRVTNRGTPVATLGPVDVSAADELTLREGTQVMTFPPGIRVRERTDDVLAESRRRR